MKIWRVGKSVQVNQKQETSLDSRGSHFCEDKEGQTPNKLGLSMSVLGGGGQFPFRLTPYVDEAEWEEAALISLVAPGFFNLRILCLQCWIVI